MDSIDPTLPSPSEQPSIDTPIAFTPGAYGGDPPVPPPPRRYPPADPHTGSPLLTYSEHLVELRNRLVKSMLALAITTAIAWPATPVVFDLLKSRAGDVHLIYTGVAEMLTTYVKVAFIAGVMLAMPVWLYQLIAFIAPGLTRSERRLLFTALPAVLVCFLLGVVFGYFVLLPPALQFLLHFGGDIADPLIRVGDYVGTVVGLLFWLGVVFETPLVIYLLARLGIVTPRLLAHYRRHAIVVAFVIAAVITPTVDPVNQTLVAVPIIVLYEVGILLSRVAVRARGRAGR